MALLIAGWSCVCEATRAPELHLLLTEHLWTQGRLLLAGCAEASTLGCHGWHVLAVCGSGGSLTACLPPAVVAGSRCCVCCLVPPSPLAHGLWCRTRCRQLIGTMFSASAVRLRLSCLRGGCAVVCMCLRIGALVPYPPSPPARAVIDMV